MSATMVTHQNGPALRKQPGPRPKGHALSTKHRRGPGSRGPYRTEGYELRLASRMCPQPPCKCGCGQPVDWNTGKAEWRVFADGHYRKPQPYHRAEWLRDQYEVQRKTLQEIADECGVNHSVVRKFMVKFGIPTRDRSESRMGRKVGAKNPAWKGGVAQWDYAPDWKAIARKIRDRDEWTCQSCGEQRKRWGHSLHVHHIDGNKLNNDQGNLTSLCASCHRQAHRGEVI